MKKIPPNPYGKKGSPIHVKMVKQVADEVEEKGLIEKIYYLNSTHIIRLMKRMKSSQINFYFTQEDVKILEQFIKENGLVILSQPTKTKEFNIVDSLLWNDTGARADKLITSPELMKQIVLKYIESKNYYIVDVIQSPVIEFFYPKNIDNKMLRGRIYYVKDSLSEDDKLVPKSNEFIELSSNLMKWVKKNIKNVKYNGFENFLVTQNTVTWLIQSKGELLLNNIL